MIIESNTGIGNRKNNEDVIWISNLHPHYSLYLIADGMGGYNNGDVAANLVVENISTFVNAHNDYSKITIANAIKKANLAVKSFNEESGSKSGATIAGVLIDENCYHLFWIGDVQIDVFSDIKLIFRSKSHSMINELKKEWEIIPFEMISRYKHIVTKSISGKREIIDFGYEELKKENITAITITSDGFHNIFDPSELITSSLDQINAFIKIKAEDNYSYIVLKELNM